MAFDQRVEADRVEDLGFVSAFSRAPVVGTILWMLGGAEAKKLQDEEEQDASGNEFVSISGDNGDDPTNDGHPTNDDNRDNPTADSQGRSRDEVSHEDMERMAQNPQESPSAHDDSESCDSSDCMHPRYHDGNSSPSAKWTLTSSDGRSEVSVGEPHPRHLRAPTRRTSRKTSWGDEVEGRHLVEVLGETVATTHSTSAPELLQPHDSPRCRERLRSRPIKSVMKRSSSISTAPAMPPVSELVQPLPSDRVLTAQEMTHSVAGSLAAISADRSRVSAPPIRKSSGVPTRLTVSSEPHARPMPGRQNVALMPRPTERLAPSSMVVPLEPVPSSHAVLHPSMCVPQGIADASSGTAVWGAPVAFVNGGSGPSGVSITPPTAGGHYSPQWGWYITTTPPTPEQYRASLSVARDLPRSAIVAAGPQDPLQQKQAQPLPLPGKDPSNKKPFPFGGSRKQKEQQEAGRISAQTCATVAL